MHQSGKIIAALKKALRAQGVTYRQVASELGLSEASIKRMLATQHLTLERLERMAALAHCNLSDLVRLSEEQARQLTSLTHEQEEEIAADLSLLLIAVSVISGFSFQDLLTQYTLSEAQVTRKLAALDRLKLIELNPGNRIRLLIAANFHWLPNGPIQTFFLQRVARDFLASNFDRETEKLLVLNGLCSAATNTKIQVRLQNCLEEALQLINEDRRLPMAQKRGNTLVLALREWRFSGFDRLLKGESYDK